MKKILISVVVLFLILTASVYSDSSEYFKGGRLVLGGSASIGTDVDDFSNIDLRLNPDIGFFILDNLLLDSGIDFRYSDDFLSLDLVSGMKYFFSGPILVPSVGSKFAYTPIDDFSGLENYMSIWMTLGCDIFLLESLAFYTELRSPAYYSYDGTSDISTWMQLRFGFHYFIPVGPLEFTS